jgi:ABC-type uncharacterized transport system permease subunit
LAPKFSKHFFLAPLPWYQALAILALAILAIMTQPTKVGGKYRLCGKLAFAEAV